MYETIYENKLLASKKPLKTNIGATITSFLIFLLRCEDIYELTKKERACSPVNFPIIESIINPKISAKNGTNFPSTYSEKSTTNINVILGNINENLFKNII